MVRLSAQVALLGLITTSLLGSCQPATTNQPSDSAPSVATQESNIETSDAESLLTNTPPDSPDAESLLANTPPDLPDTFISGPQRQCYQLNDDSLTTNLRLKIDPERKNPERKSIQGDARTLVKNHEAEDSTSYAQSFTGTLADNQGELQVFTWRDNDIQIDDETWSFTDETLEIDGHVLNLTDCELVDPAFQDVNGLEASDLIDNMAFRLSETVQLAPGISSITLNNSVLQGTQNLYYLRTQPGEQMDLSIKSSGNNAIFSVISPSNYILAYEAQEETILLPHPGDHMVIVDGTGENNVTYELTIGIEPAAAR